MITIPKMLMAGLLCLASLGVAAQPHADGHHGHGPAPAAPAPAPHAGCPMHSLTPSVDMQGVKVCYAPDLGAFVVIDSVECSVHLVKVGNSRLDTAASFRTDVTHKRHDLKNIMRPVSVGAMGPYVLVLASAVNDTSYVAILDSNMHLLARRGFNSPMTAMHREHGALIVTGTNPYGYDINVLPLHRLDFAAFDTADIMSHHYRVAKQSEKIKDADPVGIGLTATAVAVVFIALVCIALIIAGSGRLITRAENRGKGKAKDGSDGPQAARPTAPAGSDEDEVYAAIAAAISLYNDELHDDEASVITICSHGREWTPWNAKYYNMNQYFNNRR